MTNPGLLLIRADGAARIGSGHVMRCLALGQAWQDAGGLVTFLMASSTSALQERVRAEGMDFRGLAAEPGSPEDLRQTLAVVRELQPSWVILDGYRFGSEYQRALKESGSRLLMFDDCGQTDPYCADLVLNPNPGVDPQRYARRAAHTQLLLGTRYVPLRREFGSWREWRRTVPEVARKILVTLGGGDLENVTTKVLAALQRMENYEVAVTVLLGGSNPHVAALEAAAATARFPVRLRRDAPNVPELMAEADMAMAAGGTTAWELAFMGLPALLLILAPNQTANVEQLVRRGAASSLGWHEKLSPETVAAELAALRSDAPRRAEMSRRGRSWIDGGGAFRVWLHLSAHRLELRPVTEEHCRLKWEWINDPTVRAVSFSSELITWERHVEWFRAKLRDPNCYFWLATNEAHDPVGQVRFERVEDRTTAILSISLDAKYRGQNLGPLLIWIACRKLFAETPIQRIEALVKTGNTASQRAFKKAGFQEFDQRLIKGHSALVYELRKPSGEGGVRE